MDMNAKQSKKGGLCISIETGNTLTLLNADGRLVIPISAITDTGLVRTPSDTYGLNEIREKIDGADRVVIDD